jgi:hypothetical protein
MRTQAKAKEDPITAADLAEYVNRGSDFAFEMQVLTRLRTLGFDCSHSGSYRDPVTEKIRQFDIRAIKNQDSYTLTLAVECKNLRSNLPLLLSAVPRVAAEAFHDLIIRQRGSFSYSLVRHVTGNDSIYKPGEMVAKQTDQVGHDGKGNYSSDDQRTFDKLNQAVNSCQDLVKQFALETSPPLVRAIVPLLVVPSGHLWQVDYSGDGELREHPRTIHHATLFLDHSWSVATGYLTVSYRLSHIEIATFEALPTVIQSYFSSGGFFSLGESLLKS